LLFDLLTAEKAEAQDLRFDIDLLSERLTAVSQCTGTRDDLGGLAVGLFGASTGAASALRTAVLLPSTAKAVVSRGGRPDLAMEVLDHVSAPTPLIVGGLDGPVIDRNQRAYAAMGCKKRLVIVEGATHLFEVPGKLEEVARLTIEWLTQLLVRSGARAVQYLSFMAMPPNAPIQPFGRIRSSPP
jgi:pimeloyl-ACP methyl ester carboxylesterase